MTLEEAKKILEKEGFNLKGPGKPGVVSEAFAEYEAPEICKAMQIVCSAGFQLAMLAGVFDERKERLKKEYEKNTKAPDSAKNCIKEDSVVINPALKESASQFNDALLDEQAKKIKRLGKEISKLNSIIHDKNAVLSDVAEELRLTKIREKNLVELGLKYVVENEKLKKELANKTELVKIVRNGSKEYCDYGVAANEFIKELAHLYVLASNNGIINIEMLERCKNYQTYGFPANCNRETKKEINDIARGKENKKPRIPTPELSEEELMKLQEKACVDIAEEGADQSAIIVQYNNGITLSKEEAEIIERCTKNGTELHYSEKDGLTYTNMFGKEMPIRCLRGMFHVFTDEEIENMRK